MEHQENNKRLPKPGIEKIRAGFCGCVRQCVQGVYMEYEAVR